jgi:site-specific DNA-methyltransferase (adenine-specific)
MMQTNYNPDVLTCLANLSNDEVFTPPNLVNDMLDLLPAELWSNPDAKFLDPVCKSGVFLREMAKRLMKGLETQIPDKQQRINHIFSQQLYGIAITELTSLLSRRSVYCSKTANSKYSVCETFQDEQGNIRYERMQHTWHPSTGSGGKCIYCGASQEVYDRGEEAENYAYNFIHTDKPEKIFNMKFDVIIGNPPYQLNVGVEKENYAIPIFQKFIEQAKKLNPRYLTMIIPSRWFTGGRGLDDFRKEMLNDFRIRKIVDYVDARDCFSGVDVPGGVLYFLWDKEYSTPLKK